MDLFTYLIAKKGHNTHRDLFSYLLGKGTGGGGTYTTFSGVSLNISNTLQANIKNIALEGNTTQDGTPTPDTPIPIKIVTGEQNIELKNKNLLNNFNENRTFSGVQVTTNSDKSITLNGTCTSNYAINIITNWSLSLKNGKTYTLSGCPNLGGRDVLSLELYSNSPTNQYITDLGEGKTFTLKADRTYRCYIAIKSGQTYDNVTLYPMVEEGSIATEYVPYQSQTYPLSLGNIELAGIDDYKDYIFKNVAGSPYYNADLDLNGWYKYKNINKIILNGTESWIYDSKPSTPTPRTVIRTNIERHDKGIYFSNYFIYNSQTSNRIIINDNSIALYISLDNIIANIEETDSNSIRVQKMKSWLASNNTTVYYSLVTPTYDKITDTTLIQQLENINKARSYKGTTIIECTSENTDNETIVFSGDIKVTSVNLDNPLNTSLLSNNIQEETNIDDINEIEETLSLDNEIKDEVSE